jgi:putative intracellular protease/amidase
MPGKKILMLTGDFTEEYEIFVFQQGMEAVGHTVHVICPDKKKGDILKTSLHDFEGHQTYTEKLGHDFVINKTFSEVIPEEYDAVYCAGGRGPEYIRTDKRIQALVRHFHEAPQYATACRYLLQSTAWCAVTDGCACRWHYGLRKGLDGSRSLHARMPESTWH